MRPLDECEALSTSFFCLVVESSLVLIKSPAEINCSCYFRLRKRPAKVLTEAQIDERCVTIKSWAHYKLKEHLSDIQMIDGMLYSQQRALDELRNESEELYQQAIQVSLYNINNHIIFYIKLS